ncbi:MAG: NAD(P) transhydrogenase subunit alpha [Acidobacteria bacterium]|nr:NAD(P) transhydrogenase subunit alpha [Acidobacteriota bacterium]
MPSDLITSLYVFVLAGFVGFEVIRRVSPLLHTPLMSLTNALDAIAVVASMSNVVGGFLITDRMLGMFKASKAKKRQ